MSGRSFGVVKIIAFLELESPLNMKINLPGQAKISIFQRSLYLCKIGQFISIHLNALRLFVFSMNRRYFSCSSPDKHCAFKLKFPIWEEYMSAAGPTAPQRLSLL